MQCIQPSCCRCCHWHLCFNTECGKARSMQQFRAVWRTSSSDAVTAKQARTAVCSCLSPQFMRLTAASRSTQQSPGTICTNTTHSAGKLLLSLLVMLSPVMLSPDTSSEGRSVGNVSLSWFKAPALMHHCQTLPCHHRSSTAVTDDRHNHRKAAACNLCFFSSSPSLASAAVCTQQSPN